MVAQTLFSTLDQNLRKIMRSDEPFGGVSILAVGDFCQLPPIMGGPVYSLPSTKSLKAFAPNMWPEKFKIYELKEIIRQSRDPIFAAILNRVREGKQTTEDCDELEKLNETDVTNWPLKDALKLYPTNHLAGLENKKAINELGSEQHTIIAKDSPRPISPLLSIHHTGNLPQSLIIFLGARFLLTVNLNIEDHLVNGSIGTIRYIQQSSSLLNTNIFIKIDDPVAGNLLKSTNNPMLKKFSANTC